MVADAVEITFPRDRCHVARGVSLEAGRRFQSRPPVGQRRIVMESVIRLFPHRKDNTMRVGIGSSSVDCALVGRAKCPVIRASRMGIVARLP
jgi:hypothetical protein